MKRSHHTSSSPNLDMKGVDAQFLASSSYILSSQHSSVRRRLVTIGLDFHSTCDTADGFAATGITQNISLQTTLPDPNSPIHNICTNLRSVTWTKVSLKEAKIRATPKTSSPVAKVSIWSGESAHSSQLTFSNLRPKRDVLGGSALDLLFWRHTEVVDRCFA